MHSQRDLHMHQVRQDLHQRTMLPRSLGHQDVVLLHLHLRCVNHKMNRIYMCLCVALHIMRPVFSPIKLLFWFSWKTSWEFVQQLSLIYCTDIDNRTAPFLLPMCFNWYVFTLLSEWWFCPLFFNGLLISNWVVSFCVNKLIDREHQNNGSGGESDLRTGKLEVFLVKLKKNNFSWIKGI